MSEVDRLVEKLGEHVGEILDAMSNKLSTVQDEVDKAIRSIGAGEEGADEASSSGSSGSNATPRRKMPVEKRRSRCPFCSKSNCRDPSQCGLSLSWATRCSIHTRKGLCPSYCCYKQHTNECRRLGKVRCAFCNGRHISLWCARLAGRQQKL